MIYREDNLGIDPITISLIVGGLIKAGQAGYGYYQANKELEKAQATYKDYIVAKGVRDYNEKTVPKDSGGGNMLPAVAAIGGGLLGLILLIKS